MKKLYLGLAIAGLLAGCASTDDSASNNSSAAATNSSSTAAATIADPQLTAFRSNSGKSDFWVKTADKNAGKGDVGSSKDTAFGDEGSARLRFISASDDFSAQPGLSQQINGLKTNTDYVLSFYYADKKGPMSITEVIAGANGADGKTLGEQAVHVKNLSTAPQGEVKKSFRQAQVEFNSGSNTSATIYAKLKVTDASAIDTSGDIGKQTEVRIDEFKLSEK